MNRIACLALVVGLPAAPHAGAYTSGSSGAFGPVEVLSGSMELPLPTDGVVHATTVSVAAGATLSFTPNGLNTPVFLLATGDVNVAGRIEVSGQNAIGGFAGQGGPGGFDGGGPGQDGDGPGGGRAGLRDFGGDLAFGSGVFGCTGSLQNRPRDGALYGNAALLDLVGGSGAGGSDVGSGGGGGAILIASDTRIVVSGTIAAEGGHGPTQHGGGGSGGAIRLVAPVVSGNGILTVLPGMRGTGVIAGPGRIRIDALDRRQLGVVGQPACSLSSGSIMIARAQGLGSLSIVSVAGQAVPPNSNGEVIVDLDPGAPSNQEIVVEARDHHASLPIEVVILPVSGDKVVVQADVPANAGAPMQVTVPVTLPAGSPLRVSAWTR